jgi:hypothetical protein
LKSIKIPLTCKCGELAGEILTKPADGNHIICYCDDCQIYAKYLGAEKTVLNENGGTEIFQVTPNKVSFTRGIKNIGCLRLGPKGLNRWCAKCCQTPLANTLGARVAFTGILTSIIDFNKIGMTEVEALGRIQSRCMAKYAHGKIIEKSHPKYPLGITLKIIKMIVFGKIFKSYNPNPFFESKTGKLISEPVYADREKLATL